MTGRDRQRELPFAFVLACEARKGVLSRKGVLELTP